MIYVANFQKILASVKVPVLAIFGEKDTSVNWRSTMALYSRTIGKNPHASLTIRTFPDGNHNIQQSRTGGLREMLEMRERRLRTIEGTVPPAHAMPAGCRFNPRCSLVREECREQEPPLRDIGQGTRAACWALT